MRDSFRETSLAHNKDISAYINVFFFVFLNCTIELIRNFRGLVYGMNVMNPLCVIFFCCVRSRQRVRAKCGNCCCDSLSTKKVSRPVCMPFDVLILYY